MAQMISRLLFVVSALSVTGLSASDDFKLPPKKKDPVEMAFALPKGMFLTAKEMEYATKVRAQLEPRLRDALERVENATDKTEQLKAAKDVRQVRDEIQAAIQSIIRARYAKAAQEYAKKQAERAQAARKRASQNKKRGHRNKKKRRR
jgi:hypothetical protein